MNEAVFASASRSNSRNQAIGQLLRNCGQIAIDPAHAVEFYTRQCSLNVTAKDLAVMGATLADGGVNPLTRNRVLNAGKLRVLGGHGDGGSLRDVSGDWLYDVGLPGEGVSAVES